MKKWLYIAGHNVLLAHAAAVDRYRTAYKHKQHGRIGITNNVDWREPITHDPADIAAGQRYIEFGLGWFADPIWKGDYPESMRRIMGSNLPSFNAAQKALVHGSADFFGLNHYGTTWVQNSHQAGAGQQYATTSTEGFERAESVWLYSSGWGCRKLLNWIHNRYNSPEIFVTEGGWSMAASTAAQGVPDHNRTMYYANYTSEILKAIDEDGVNVKGYFAWSLMDNFEWERGYIERFGVVFNDFGFGHDPNAPTNTDKQPTRDQKRTRKDSSRWLQKVWKANALVDPSASLK